MQFCLSNILRNPSLIQEREADDRGVLSSLVAQGIKNPLHQGLSARLVKLRRSVQVPAYKLSEAAGLSENVVSSVESETHMPRLGTVERIASALGVPSCWLAFGDEGALEFRGRRTKPVIPDDPPEAVGGGVPFQALHLCTGQRLRQKRDELGVSLRELADAAGVSFETIRKVENGEVDPRLDTCERIAVALGVSPCWLAFGVGASN